MEEKILQTKKNGMTMLLLTLLGYVAAVVVGGIGFVMLYTTFLGFIPLAIAVIYAIIGIFLFAGLKVLKPEEALVLTLFGDYIGTLKGEGFYWVNPFCTAVNPAAGTVLSQSGDVQQRPVVQADREKEEDLPEGDDPEQLPPEDQRLPGQPGGNRHCGDLAGDRHRQGRVQCRQLQRIPVPAV